MNNNRVEFHMIQRSSRTNPSVIGKLFYDSLLNFAEKINGRAEQLDSKQSSERRQIAEAEESVSLLV